MRLIDAEELETKQKTIYIEFDNVAVPTKVIPTSDLYLAPTIDAEPVRHEGNTTFVSTNSLESYADRIIVGQGTLCKVYYREEPVRHGRWEPYYEPTECFVDARLTTEIRNVQTGWICSECGRYEQYSTTEEMPYCHCGAKMRGDEDG